MGEMGSMPMSPKKWTTSDSERERSFMVFLVFAVAVWLVNIAGGINVVAAMFGIMSQCRNPALWLHDANASLAEALRDPDLGSKIAVTEQALETLRIVRACPK